MVAASRALLTSVILAVFSYQGASAQIDPNAREMELLAKRQGLHKRQISRGELYGYQLHPLARAARETRSAWVVFLSLTP